MSRAIASLAMVKTAWEMYRRDYVENFVPFVATLARKKNYRYIDCSNLQSFLDDFRNEFSLSIPHHPMLTILNRACKRGVFKRVATQLIPIEAIIIKYDFSDIAIKKGAELNQIISAFIEFSKKKFSVEVSEQDAQDSLNSLLNNHDLDVLFASQDKTILPESSTSKRLKYLMNSFFNHAKVNSPQLFNYIVEICVGHILANTILYDKSFSNFKGGLRRLEIYLDTGLIFRLLGIQGMEYQKVYVDLMKSMLEQEAVLLIFRHTFEEIFIIFRNCLRWFNHPDYDPAKANPALLYFMNNGKTESDLHQYISTLEDRLNEYQIKIKDSPDFSRTQEHQIDEDKLRDNIIESYNRNHSFDETEKQMTIDRDIKSLSAIQHLRRGCLPQTLKSARHIFVTTNVTLASINSKFERESLKGQFHIPACLTDVFIGTLVWMQSPAKWIEINERKVLADCTAAIKPDSLFVKKVVSEAKKLKYAGKVNSDEFLAVSRSIIIQGMLMERTLGDTDAVDGSSIEEVLEKIRADATYIPRYQLMAEKEKNQELVNQIQYYERESFQKRVEVKEVIRKLVSQIFNVIYIIVMLMFVVCIVIPFVPEIDSRLKYFALLVAIICGVLSFGYGVNLKGWKDNMINSAVDRVSAFLEKHMFSAVSERK